MNKLAYTAFIAFVSAVLTLASVTALSSQSDEAPEAREITPEELARHDHAGSCWKAIHGRVYDLTDYLPFHPSDEALFLEWCGKEASEGWDNKRPGVPHSPAAAALLERYRVGTLSGWEAPEAVAEEPAAPREARAGIDPRLAQAQLGLPLDGTYRGGFADRGYHQVQVQFRLDDGHIHDLSYRHLYYGGIDYLALEEGDSLQAVMRQHQQIAERLEGAPLARLFALYTPEHLVDDIDGFTGASLRGAKVASAMRDALNRGVYRWP
ncbi:cytochrome b5 domain-containing protein [Halomonas sp. 328]|uniref:cytochrome b5 domain-containing protein n=1 Tax=Halomonas sp. 328 TaxID=2776704 RepID=UPI0018A70E09|nr:cytochrome b5-like heme/steroid binding domain-containing protein [Halomonas sp. 328]MBF8222027.1 cytochrome b5 domain-containing protein [Halomonas sp. 328]